jgi:hypothetical protein
MKKLILITFILIPGFVYSQSNNFPFPQSSNAQTSLNPELDKFCGTWSYKNNGETFEVTLMKSLHLNKSEKTSIDMLVGKYYYIMGVKLVNGNKVEGVKAIASGQIEFFPKKNKDILDFRIGDSGQQTLKTGVLIYKEGTIPSLIWQLDPPKKVVKPVGKRVVKREHPVLTTFELTKASP